MIDENSVLIKPNPFLQNRRRFYNQTESYSANFSSISSDYSSYSTCPTKTYSNTRQFTYSQRHQLGQKIVNRMRKKLLKLQGDQFLYQGHGKHCLLKCKKCAEQQLQELQNQARPYSYCIREEKKQPKQNNQEIANLDENLLSPKFPPRKKKANKLIHAEKDTIENIFGRQDSSPEKDNSPIVNLETRQQHKQIRQIRQQSQQITKKPQTNFIYQNKKYFLINTN